jgi:hypothetical protein
LSRSIFNFLYDSAGNNLLLCAARLTIALSCSLWDIRRRLSRHAVKIERAILQVFSGWYQETILCDLRFLRIDRRRFCPKMIIPHDPHLLKFSRNL